MCVCVCMLTSTNVYMMKFIFIHISYINVCTYAHNPETIPTVFFLNGSGVTFVKLFGSRGHMRTRSASCTYRI